MGDKRCGKVLLLFFLTPGALLKLILQTKMCATFLMKGEGELSYGLVFVKYHCLQSLYWNWHICFYDLDEPRYVVDTINTSVIYACARIYVCFILGDKIYVEIKHPSQAKVV